MRKDIDSLAALREKIVGVQSIGGGFWLQTMIVLDRLGVDPDKNGLSSGSLAMSRRYFKPFSPPISTRQ